MYQEPVPVSGFPVKAPVGWFDVNVRLVRDGTCGVAEDGVGEPATLTATIPAPKAKRNNL